MRRKFHTLDVFTETPLAGNPLAVVLDADGLDTARMQAIAREFNLSETVFVLEPRDPVNTARVRIFTPGHELPFAGHPTVGTAVLLGELRAPELLGMRDVGIVLEERVGPVSCTVRHLRNRAPYASFVLPKLPVHAGPLDPAQAAAAVGLATDDLGFGRHEPARFDAGVPFGFLPVRDRGVLAKAAPNPSAWATAFGAERTGAFLYCAEPEDRHRQFRARMFAPGAGIPEDPATGSAAAALAGAVMRFDRPADGDHTVVIEQGFEMGRPRVVTLGLEVTGGALVAASIGGSAVLVTQGTLDA